MEMTPLKKGGIISDLRFHSSVSRKNMKVYFFLLRSVSADSKHRPQSFFCGLSIHSDAGSSLVQC